MTPSQKQKMAAGTWYNCVDAELEALRHAARIAVHEHNTLPPDTRRSVGPALAALLGTVGKDVFIEAPFHCAYGFNIWLGDGVYLNAGCVVIDTASVVIGASTMLGPGVHIYCAEHHPDPAERKAGLEIAKPVRVGARVWIGGRATVLGGVTIGNDAIVGAGAVVTRNVAPGATVVGNPARPIRRAGGSSPTDGAEG